MKQARTNHSRRRVVLALALGVSAGCSGPRDATPLPEPPSMVVDFEKVGPPAVAPAVEATTVDIEGAPGAAPGGSLLRVTSLDMTDPPQTTSVAADGSFSIKVPGGAGQEFRFQIVQDGDRGEPRDARYVRDAGGELRFIASERFACLSLEPGYELVLSSEAVSLELESTCDATLSLANLRSRSGRGDFTLTSALPPALPAGATAALEFGLASAAARPLEDVLFVNVTLEGETIRYPLTLFAP